MKLAAIYNVFDGEELLEGSIRQIREHVDEVIAIYQVISNHGEKYDGGITEILRLKKLGLIDHYHGFIPDCKKINPTRSETNKRNYGLDKARELDCTHYILMDCDEYYDSEQFSLGVYMSKVYSAMYVPLKTYFGDPKHIIEPEEKYCVPFIHNLYHNTKVGNYNYGGVYCDPTRKDNSDNVPYNLGLDGVYMHHYSWVRKDLERKINNSSANINLKKYKNELIKACKNPYDGMEVPFYKGHKLKKVSDDFGINRYL